MTIALEKVIAFSFNQVVCEHLEYLPFWSVISEMMTVPQFKTYIYLHLYDLSFCRELNPKLKIQKPL